MLWIPSRRNVSELKVRTGVLVPISWLNLWSYAFAAVVFQFARVGDDEDAEIFLRKLHDESSVKDYVDTLSGSDLIELMDLQNGGRKDYTENDQRKVCVGVEN